MKFRKSNKVGKFEVKKVKNKGAMSKNVVRVAISPRFFYWEIAKMRMGVSHSAMYWLFYSILHLHILFLIVHLGWLQEFQ